uniref:Late embryogenesis abundant protein LEA-2 subgroup domain-containing protein n=1 Tax=Oryza brachyantha TaxID=4533 RepID=J3MAU3_ORYBR
MVMSGKQRVLAALMGTLAAIVIVSAVFAALSPAHVFFSITDASIMLGDEAADDDDLINITFVANNTSHHAEVSYHSIKMELWMRNDDYWLPMDISNSVAAGWGWQPAGNFTAYKVSSPLTSFNNESRHEITGGGQQNGASSGDDDDEEQRHPVVVIRAHLRFRYGQYARTRLYRVVVSCLSVNFIIFRPDGTYDYFLSPSKATLPVSCKA